MRTVRHFIVLCVHTMLGEINCLPIALLVTLILQVNSFGLIRFSVSVFVSLFGKGTSIELSLEKDFNNYYSTMQDNARMK